MKKKFPQYSWKDNESFWLEKEREIFKPRNGKKCYLISMFPYPSGYLHCGHARNYQITDVMTRYKHMQGYKVENFFGWDAFGLPAENAAIENKIHPKDWTLSNIKKMKDDVMSLAYIIDWSKEVATCDISYYKHQQKIFIELWKSGYAYKKEEWVNWDPAEKSVLADEQISPEGLGWRSGAKVERKKISQWFLKITAFQEELLNDLEKLRGNWPDKILKMQKNWIGKSKGCIINFPTEGKDISIFTTMPETIFGVTFIAMSAESDFLNKKAEGWKSGDLVGYCFHPLTKKKIPIYVADFVLNQYGTGAVMGVPTHDERDDKFADIHKIEKLQIFNEEKGIVINSDFLNGLTFKEARNKMFEKYGEKTIYRLKDWCISRQRYWGCPIPMIYCEKCGTVAATETVELPYDVKFGGGNPLSTNEKWLNVNCPECGTAAKRETDTMDTFFDSSWYFLRYLCADNHKETFDDRIKDMPVDYYFGGAEHAVLHLLYARFFTKVLHKIGLIHDIGEPFLRLINQGMLCSQTYRGAISQKYYYPEEVYTKNGCYFGKNNGEEEAVIEGPVSKMSKSLKNVVTPDKILEAVSKDALKLFIISDTPIDKDAEWNTKSLHGCHKFINRIWALTSEMLEFSSIDKDPFLNDIKFKNSVLNLIFQANKNLEHSNLNLFVANLYTLFNKIEEEKSLEAFKKFLILLWCTCPLISYNAYFQLFGTYICDADWDFGEKHDASREIVLTIDGKKKCILNVEEDDPNIEKIAFELSGLETYKKFVYVRGKIANFVTE